MSNTKCADLRLPDVFSVVKDDDEIRDIVGSGKHADCYIHFENIWKCQYALVEIKGAKIKDAIRQLESTVKKFLAKNIKINRIIIYLHGRLSKHEQKIYKIINNVLYRKKGNKKKVVQIRGIRVEVYRGRG